MTPKNSVREGAFKEVLEVNERGTPGINSGGSDQVSTNSASENLSWGDQPVNLTSNNLCYCIASRSL